MPADMYRRTQEEKYMQIDQTNLASLTIRRLNALPLAPSTKPASLAAVAAFGANVIALGYTLNQDALAAAQRAALKDLERSLDAAKSLKGDAKYQLMYPNFPRQVADAADIELYVNAIMHYIGDAIGVRIMPAYNKAERAGLTEPVKVISLGVADDSALSALARKLVEQGQPFSEQDKADLALLADRVSGGVTGVKENAATLAIMFPRIDWSASFTTVVDVLRLAAAYSGGDVSLAASTRFKLTRTQRRTILGMVEAILARRADAAEDFARHAEQWKRLARQLHHGEFSLRFPLASAQLDLLQRGEGMPSLNARVEAAISAGDYEALLSLVTTRPGVLARRLFELLTKFPAQRASTVAAFSACAQQVSIPVLVQLHNHFSSPGAGALPKRVILSKAVSTGLLVDNRLSGRYDDVIAAIEHGLSGRKAGVRASIDKDKAAQYAVPLAVRSASPGMRQIGRGSRIKIHGDKSTIRLFMHWRNLEDGGRVDLDLSTVFANEDFSNVETIAYYNLRSQGINAAHSGDITSAPNGAAEFIDIDIEAALAAGYRYVLPTIYNYTRQSLSLVPQAWAGVMLRTEPQSGEVFEPATVEERFDMTVNSVNATPFAFDLATRELIWMDSAVKADGAHSYNVASNQDTIVTTLRAAVMTRPMSVAKLADLVGVVYDESAEAIDPAQTAEVLQLIS